MRIWRKKYGLNSAVCKSCYFRIFALPINQMTKREENTGMLSSLTRESYFQVTVWIVGTTMMIKVVNRIGIRIFFNHKYEDKYYKTVPIHP